MTDLSNWAPFDILAGPADVYLAPVATAFPAINAAPSASWTYVGLTEGGVTVRHTQTVTPLTADQYTGNVKAIRTEEGVEIEFSFVELTAENYSLALNSNTVSSITGPPARREVSFARGVHVDLRAVLIRGRSPYGNLPAQYQVPVAYQSESPEISFVKDDKSVLHTVWTALEDLTAATDNDRFGKLVDQSA